MSLISDLSSGYIHKLGNAGPSFFCQVHCVFWVIKNEKQKFCKTKEKFLFTSDLFNATINVIVSDILVSVSLKQGDECGNLADFSAPSADGKNSFSNFSLKVRRTSLYAS